MITLSAKAARRHSTRLRPANSRLLLTAIVVVALCAAALMTGTANAENVTWINGVHVTITGNSVEKTHGVNGVLDASAVSQEQIQDDEGADWYTQFTCRKQEELSSGSPAGRRARITKSYRYNSCTTPSSPLTSRAATSTRERMRPMTCSESRASRVRLNI